MYGYGEILRIDLSSGGVSTEPIPSHVIRKYFGGGGINDWLLWEHFTKVDPGIDPKGPENVLILGLGPLGGTAAGLGSKMKFTFKGPAWNMFGDSVSGGTLGGAMRYAGYDHIVVTGRAAKPVYIWIDDDRVEIRDASAHWGKGVKEATRGIRSELGDTDVSVACVGQAAENLVSYASVTVTEERSAGRTGAGCVFGSKNLKAIAVRGSKGIPVYNPKGFLEASQEIYNRLKADPTHWGFRKMGTLGVVGFYDRIGGNAYRNNQFSRVPPEKLKTMLGRWFVDNMKSYDFSCSTGCTIGCCQICEVKGHESPLASRYRGLTGEGPEYFTVATFGMGCDIPDYAAITHLHHTCNDYGLDLGEIGGAVPFLMELWERGIINEEDSRRWCGEPLRFEWGNIEAVEKTIESVALQNNRLGEILKDGLVKAAQAIMEEKDVPVQQYVIHGKGGSTFHEEIRSFPSWAINFAVSSRGCDHLKGLNMLDKGFRKDISQAWFGSPKAGEGYTPDLKGKAAARSENYTTAINNTGVCVFRTALNPMNVDLGLLARAYTALTGIELSGEQLYASGERAYNLEKAFNSRLGLRRKDDILCERWMKEPIKEGPGKGMKAEDWFDGLLDEYYEYHGWDKGTSLQRRAKLEALDMGEVLEVLEKEGAVIG